MWTCHRCGMRHDTEEKRLSCVRDERKVTIVAIAILAVLAAVVLAAMLAWNEYVHDDWRCAFSRCVKVTK